MIGKLRLCSRQCCHGMLIDWVCAKNWLHLQPGQGVGHGVSEDQGQGQGARAGVALAKG